jgi:periplasmic protein TonB
MPREATGIRPTFPHGLSGEQQVEGRADLGFTIDRQGWARDIYVMGSSHTELEQPAMQALQRSRFRPGRKDGQDVRHSHPHGVFEFRLSD